MKDVDISAFWNRVKTLCTDRKISQQDLSKSIGLPFNSIPNKIWRNAVPSVVEAYKIASALGTTVDFLLLGNTEVTTSSRLNELLSDLSAVIDRYKQ